MKHQQQGNCPNCHKRFPLEKGGHVRQHVIPGTRIQCCPNSFHQALPKTERPKAEREANVQVVCGRRVRGGYSPW